MLITVSCFATIGFILAVIFFKEKPPLPPPGSLKAPSHSESIARLVDEQSDSFKESGKASINIE
jgi:hypothetical protein